MSKPIPSVVKEIREQLSKITKSRRNIALLSTAGLLDFVPVSLYQLGVIRHLPDLPSKLFDSDYVNASEDARIAGLPDGPVSLLMYAVNLALITGSVNKGKKRLLVDYLVAANAIGQAAGGVYYLYNMSTRQKKVCLYCVAGAVINFATLIPLYKLFRSRN